MASNGFMRYCCYRCIFHEDDQDFRDICLLNDSDNEDSEFVFDRLKWISANDCDRSDYLYNKHHEKCEHFVDIHKLRAEYRKKFAIQKDPQ